MGIAIMPARIGKEVQTMPLIRWTPMRSMLSFRDEMDRLLDDLYGRMSPAGESNQGDWCPAMDLKESEGEITAVVELPGLAKDDIQVSVKGDVLTVSGEKKQEETKTEENVHRVERSYGYFKRNMVLPVEVEAGKIKASFKDGILKVEMPKVEAKKSKEIPIQVA
jgi:HSP20 family protein